ncbi:MAG: hypothetical protein Q9209_006732 [Squamulea sp. 1 TL-2023]
MARRISVFAGLGSSALFSSSTEATALADASIPEAQALLNACHKIFLHEFSTTSRNGDDTSGIALRDFQDPQDLLTPPAKYHKNAVIQNTTLSLVQMLRYLAYSVEAFDGHVRFTSATAGVCSGLLTSIAVATCNDIVSFLSYGQRSFHVALLLGRRLEEHMNAIFESVGLDRDFPWSVVIDGVTKDQAEDLIRKYEKNNPGSHIYVSARTTERCLTLSGRGDELRKFSYQALPKNCRVRPTNIYSAYHDAQTLIPVKAHILADAADRALTFPSLSELRVPLYLGEAVPLTNSATAQQSMLEVILDWILTRPVDWLSGQDQIFSNLAAAESDGCLIREILNFGPGYGVSKTEAQQRPTVKVLDASVGKSNDRSPNPPSTGSYGDIAIVGMAVDLPGAPDTASLWKVLKDEINVVTEIPESRFHIGDFDKSSKAKGNDARRLLGTKFGNFMDDPFRFDHSFFGISPREAKSVDPQQRVLLQTTYRALDDAGYVPDSTPSFARETFGCYIGNATLDYTDNLKDDIDVYYSPGTLRAFLSGRISYVFGFSGPSMTVDTACSSSMVSIFHACRALVSGDCRAAVAGGVNVITSPDMYLGLDRAHFLSPSGQCKAFDASADGYCRSEGCGVFVLKRLSDALDESDNVLGIIKGIEINQSGNADSITHPHAPTQELLFKKLLTKADIDPLRVSVVEAHGTGTQAGDPQEASSIRNVLCENRDNANPLFLTSIKANIGHCEAASGAAALAKLLLMSQNDSIPKQVSLHNLNPRIDPLGIDGTIIPRQQTDWTSTEGQPRVAMLNNFGAAGSNAALLLQEPHQKDESDKSTKRQQRRTYMLGFSAKTPSSLLVYKTTLIAFLEENADTIDLCDLCYTSSVRRQIYNYRSSLSASSVGELAKKLGQADYIEVKKDTVSRIIFVFSGQGSQYISMGKELFATSTIFRKTVLQCESWLQKSGFPSCLQIIDQEPDANESSTNDEHLQAMQIAIFVVEVGLARMWCEWGVQPTMVCGHSIGQYAALVVAGTLELHDALKIVAFRARLMIEQCPLATTGMLAVNRSGNDIEQYLSTRSVYKDLSIACYNSPHDCVVGGPLGPLGALKDDLKGNHKYKAAMLGNPLAYHTKATEHILSALTTIAASVKWSASRIPVICNVLGRVVPRHEALFTADFPARHCRQTVLFEQGIQDVLSNHLVNETEQVTWLEIGPHPSILPMIKSHPLAKNHHFIATMRKSISPWHTISEAQSHVYRSSIPIEWRSTFSRSPEPKCITLPSYQFDYTDFRVGYRREIVQDEALSQPSSTGYNFLACQKNTSSSSNPDELIFDTPIENLVDYIAGHLVCGFALCPASVYHETALAAAAVFEQQEDARSGNGPDSHVNMLSQIAYLNPLLYVEGVQRFIRTKIDPAKQNQEGGKSFEVSSFDSADAKKITLHCQGHIRRQQRATVENKFTILQAQLKKPVSRLDSDESIEVFHTRAIYEKLFPRVVAYSKMYQAIQTIRVSADGAEALATVAISTPFVAPETKFAVNPIFMDVVLHVAGFVANLAADDGDAFICKGVKSMSVIMAPSDLQQVIKVYCSNTNIAKGSSLVGNGYAMSSTGQLLAVFKEMHFTRVKLKKVEASFRHVSGVSDRESKSSSNNKISVGHSQPTTNNQHTPTDGKTDLEQALRAIDPKSIIAEVCGAEETSIASESELAGLGIDSLMILELGSRIQGSFNANFNNDELTACVTVRDVEALVLSKNGQASPANANTAPLERATEVDGALAAAGTSGQSIESVLVEVCGVKAGKITAETELESLGIDSLMMFEIEDKLKATDLGNFTGEALASCKTVGDIECLIKKGKSVDEIVQIPQSKDEPVRPRLADCSSSSSNSGDSFSDSTPQLSTPPTRASSPESLSETGSGTSGKEAPKLFDFKDPFTLIQPGKRGKHSPPLVLIHDGSGLSSKYRSIKDQSRPLWGVSNPKISSADSWADLDAMARAYVDRIRVSIGEPLILGGWSFGGVVAFHAAHILMKQHHKVVGVVLIDSPAPLEHQPLPKGIIDEVVSANTSKTGQKKFTVNRAIVRQFELNTALLTGFTPSADGPFPDLVLLRSKEGYTPKRKDCPSHAWLEDRSDPRKAVEGWEMIVQKPVKVIDIPGNHFDVFKEANVSRTALFLVSQHVPE